MKTKKFLINKLTVLSMLIVVILLTINFTINADGNHDKTINQVIKEIRETLNLKEKDKIDPGKVPDNLLEELGEAVMSERHPNEREHEWMDEMMGGEGSISLKAMHRAMGYRYLDGDYNYGNTSRGRNFMRRDHGYMTGSNSMMWMNNYSHSPWNIRNNFFKYRWIGGITMIIIFLVFAGLIGYLIYIAAAKNLKSKNQEENAFDILKRRYASGEITKKDFEEMKKDIL